jgi:hypothetical protein
VEQSPWVGSERTRTSCSGKVGNTPHNGYLSIAVTSGFPRCASSSRWRVRLHRLRVARLPAHPRRGWQGATGLTAAAGIVCVLIHNLVDTTVTPGLRRADLLGCWRRRGADGPRGDEGEGGGGAEARARSARAPPQREERVTGTFAELRRLFSSAALYALGGLAQRGVGFLLIPVYTRVIEPAEYGVLEILNAFSGVFFAVLTLGLTSAINKCWHRDCETDEDRRKLLGTALLIDLPILLAGAASSCGSPRRSAGCSSATTAPPA